MKASCLRSLLTMAFLAPCTGIGADVGIYDGKWSATYEGVRGRSVTVSVRLQGNEGEWGHITKPELVTKLEPCNYRDEPITVIEATPEILRFEISRSKRFAGCADAPVKLTPVGPDKLVGTIGKDEKRTITMVRD